jgi:uncharacterized membrane protein YebE (DUF533 family)
MNAADILGELLGGKGGGIFKDIFGGAGGAAPAPARERETAPPPSAGDIASQAKELEDMIGVGRRGVAPSRPAPRQQVPANHPWETPQPARVPPPLPEAPPDDPVRRDSEATVLIRAMIHAAKADGRLTPEEQKALVDRMGGASPEVIRFLQHELDQPTDVREFAWSVPLGMEGKVYMISLTAITVDSESEASYLDELAHGLRLPREVRNHLHQHLGLPALA